MGYLATIKEIDAARVDGKFVAEDGSVPFEGQDIIDGLLQTCYSIIDEALKRFDMSYRQLMSVGFADDI